MPPHHHPSRRAGLQIAADVRTGADAARAAAANGLHVSGSAVATTRSGGPTRNSSGASVICGHARTEVARLAPTSDLDGDRDDPEPAAGAQKGRHPPNLARTRLATS